MARPHGRPSAVPTYNTEALVDPSSVISFADRYRLALLVRAGIPSSTIYRFWRPHLSHHFVLPKFLWTVGNGDNALLTQSDRPSDSSFTGTQICRSPVVQIRVRAAFEPRNFPHGTHLFPFFGSPSR